MCERFPKYQFRVSSLSVDGDLCYRFLFVANIFVCVSSLYVKLREIYEAGLYLEVKLVGLGKRFVCGIFLLMRVFV